MKGQVLKIVLKKDMAFLTHEVALDFKQINLPDPTVKFQASAFWTIRVINYIEKENRLFVEVLAYQVGETEFSNNQIELADTLITIEKVTFKSIDTTGLLRTLFGKESGKILPPKPETVYRQEAPIQMQSKIERQPIIEIYNEPFSIPIKDVMFHSVKVVFEKKLQQFKKVIEFEILNENILEEYDAIKNYFATIFKAKKIQVVPTIKRTDGIITSIEATSNEIEKVDKSFIEEIKFELIKVARRNESSVEKQLFTVEEYLETFVEEDFNAHQFFNDDNDFFDKLLEKSETKHYNQLRFLSSKHKADIQKLRFVHKPFSFVFLLKGIDKFHIVWETLDTEEATYIWTVDSNNLKDLNQVLIHTDKTINSIIKHGKSEYISRNEPNFDRVFHDYADLDKGFKKWKGEIERVLGS